MFEHVPETLLPILMHSFERKMRPPKTEIQSEKYKHASYNNFKTTRQHTSFSEATTMSETLPHPTGKLSKQRMGSQP